MYKTVRHGENSLQYTILPQDGDEESGKSGGGQGGKSGGSGGKGGGSRGAGNNNGGGRGCCRPRTALFLVLTALLIGVVTASVAVPLLLTTDLLSLPGAAFPFTEHRPQMQVRPHQYQHHPAYNASAFRRRLTPPNPVPTPTPSTTPAAEVTTPASPTANPESPTTPLPSTEKPASGGPVGSSSGREPEEMPAAPGPPDGNRGVGGGGDVQSTTASVPAPSKVKGLDDDDDDDDLEDDEDDDDEEESIPPVAVPMDERPDDEDDEDDEGEGPSADGPAGAHTASTEAVRGDAAGYLAAPAAPSPPGGNGNASHSNTIWVTPPRNSTRNDGGYLLAQQYGAGSTPEVSAADAPGEVSTDLGDSMTTTTAASSSTTTTTAAAAVPQMPQVTATTPPRTSTYPAAPTDGAKFGNKQDAWQGSRWLFTDPSSYLQWTGYNRDGLLLPVILGTVVILVPATIAVCFMIIRRRRRQKDLRRETIGKIASDLQYGDKATLLADASEEE